MGKRQFEEKTHKIIGRLHRLQGQIHALEHHLDSEEPLTVLTQFQAAIAAAKACQLLYVTAILEDTEIDAKTKEKIISRLIQS
jgi:DNA-binding FrmR family transcriptional regulator